MKAKFICTVLLLSAIGFSFKPEDVRHQQKALKVNGLTTCYSWSNGTIDGNQVYVYIDRDDNSGGPNVSFTGYFNSATSSFDYTIDMGDSLHWEGWITGPREIGDVYLGNFTP